MKNKFILMNIKDMLDASDSTEAYFKYSLEMLDIDISSRVFKSNWPIYTNTNDTPPTKYLRKR